jgi:hypothetical protein
MDQIQLHFFARHAADAFLSNGVSLNESIAKIAEDNGLNPDQCRRVVEIANHQTNDALRKQASDRTYTFDMADYPAVEALINTAEPMGDLSKTASAILHGIDQEDRSTVDKLAAYAYISADQAAANKRAVLSNLHAFEKMAERDSRMIAAKYQAVYASFAEDVEKLGQVTKDFILTEGGDVATLCKVAQVSDPEKADQWGKIFAHVSDGLKKLGHPFTGVLADKIELSADYEGRFPQSLPGPEVVIINGASPVHGILTPINQKVGILDSLRFWKNEFDSLASTLRESQKSITDSDSVQPELVKMTDALFKVAQAEGDTQFAASTVPRRSDGESVKSYLKRSAAHAATIAKTPVKIS